ncbi:hypothetical protein ASG32_07940 [Methylobacterium sp. Leaf361]|uniref:hypothetical protein n=1 Tax=Methylobacterium sp. Leaf361 TaxID=1736352 RepID=UPI0006F61A52|nr:hypothetical protein [Methylobacterium sp. Leaf361]KQS75017.1 hypothetical protein ASG32_07940 [Methylobacterium sp. Leaf361]
MSTSFKPRSPSALKKAGDPRWSARVKDGIVLVKDMASGEEVQATAYTVDGDAVRFALPGDNGLRQVLREEPGFDALVKVLQKSPMAAPAADTSVKGPAAGAKAA